MRSSLLPSWLLSARCCCALRLKLVLAPRFVVDDLGWNNVEWHNPEMKTPNSLALVRSPVCCAQSDCAGHQPLLLSSPPPRPQVKEGIQMDKSYVFMYCAPTRSSIMSGRLPYHVNQLILGLNNP